MLNNFLFLTYNIKTAHDKYLLRHSNAQWNYYR